VASPFERGVEPERQNLVRQPECDDASPHREHVRIIVCARQPRRIEIVAQSSADTVHFVGRDLFSLSTAAEDDTSIRAAVRDNLPDAKTDRGIVDRRLAVGAVVVHAVTEAGQRLLQVLLQRVTRVVCANGDVHGERLYYVALAMIPAVVISTRGEERVRSGHPWVYRSDVLDVQASAGDIVVVKGARGRSLAHALYSDRSQIAVRIIAFRDQLPQDWLRSRIEAALEFRRSLHVDATALRLVHGEADLLPSLIVDRYGDYLVVQALSQGIDRRIGDVVRILNDLLAPRGVLARNDPRTRTLEGLEQRVEVLAGDVPERLTVSEGRIEYEVDVRRGQKTGLFLDQRENRTAAAQYARGRLLDCFTYNGGFALALGRRCTETIAIDVSEEAIDRVRENAARNGVTVDARVGNAFDELRGMERLGERFDTIVLDPPAFAKNKAAVPNARAGYKEINLRAVKLLNHGGTLVTCSCSYNVSEALFAEIVYEAAVDAQAQVTVVEKRMQGRDHPVLLGVPETYYLKCFILRKL
jgi:23S rRNA (cytosine1962-C5)-methyltransferase